MEFVEDEALRAIVEGVEAEIGDGFLRSLVRHLAAALDVEYAFVSELSADRTGFRTLALWGRGSLLENFERPLAGTPCAAVLCGQIAHYPACLQQLFPEDDGLVLWRAESYSGVPLIDSTGAVVGHLAVFDDREMPNAPRGISIMRIFAARAVAEIERKRAEDKVAESRRRLAGILDSALDAILAFDEEWHVELFNRSAEKMFGCRASDAIGHRIDRLLTPVLEQALRALADSTVGEPDHAVWAPTGLFARRVNDGREFPIEATLSTVPLGGRRLFTLILRDVGERDRAEEQIRRLVRQNEVLSEELSEVHSHHEILGESAALKTVLERIRLVAATNTTVLILGETGTGKELVARALHAASGRRDKPFVKVNLAALPAMLVESELFGHERGAFTGALERRIGRFELADGGTIFLDEIGEIKTDLQVKLLRVLQEREFERVGGRQTIRADVRVIAATNRDLGRAAGEGSFRSDLYYRLNVFPLLVPPLRERREDIPLLVGRFVRRFAAKTGRHVLRVSPDVMRYLLGYAWPGNIRELENVVERAVILSPGPDLRLAEGALSESLQEPAIPPEPGILHEPGIPPHSAPSGVRLAAITRDHIVSVLRQTEWRIEGTNGAAALLGIKPSTLRSRMRKLGVRRSPAAAPADAAQ